MLSELRRMLRAARPGRHTVRRQGAWSAAHQRITGKARLMDEILPFDDRDGSIWLDGRLVPWRDAKFHVLTHGLHYASAVFEGERVYSGNIFRSLDHTNRLFYSARTLGFEIPFTVEEIEQAKRDTVAAMGFTDGYVRPVAWRGSEMMGVSAQASRIHVAIAAWEWPANFSDRKSTRLNSSH